MTEYNNAPEWFRPYAEAQEQLLAELGLKKEDKTDTDEAGRTPLAWAKTFPKEDKTDSDEAIREAKAWARNLPDNE